MPRPLPVQTSDARKYPARTKTSGLPRHPIGSRRQALQPLVPRARGQAAGRCLVLPFAVRLESACVRRIGAHVRDAATVRIAALALRGVRGTAGNQQESRAQQGAGADAFQSALHDVLAFLLLHPVSRTGPRKSAWAISR